ncbi:hypothetical protein F5Y18DRAFT_168085 [Xylariaceae sp. FL1019]|nr:hypothetical protein F5Y18DRAFT_168085 [Xylariaceae sp. FL1019]
MSSYDPYDAPPRQHHHHSSRRYYEERREPRYEAQETVYRVNPSRNNALVPRAREDSDLSIEEVRRDFPPPGYSRDIRRARSAEPGYDDYYGQDPRRDPPRGKKPGSVYYEEEERTRKRILSKQEQILTAVAGGIIAAGAKELWDRREAKEHGSDVQRSVAASAALGAAGAFAGYQGADFYNKHNNKEEKKSTYMVHKGRDGRVLEYYSDEDDDPRSHKSNKSFLENALSAAGLGGAIKALTGGGDDRESYNSRSRRGSPDSHRSTRSRGDTQAARMQKAAKASLIAGAAEAFRVAKEPGSWQGEKMKRVVTAAIGAGTLDAVHNPTKDTKLALLESVLGGLAGNRVLNGSRKDIEEDRATGRSRSRSRARSASRSRGGTGLAALATAGLGALGAKKLVEGRSRSRSRSRRDSYDSYDSRYDSRDPSPRRKRSRSRSIVDGARRSLAKIGLGNGPDDDRDDRSARGDSRRGFDDRYDDDEYYMRGGKGPEDDYYDDRSHGRSRSDSRSRGRSSSVSSSDLGDSDSDMKKQKSMRRKQMITAGLATVATIHAANNVYQSMEARNARQRAVRQGKLSPQEAKKLKTKALMQDAASIGIAAMGIKGAVSELKEVKEQTQMVKEWKEERHLRHERRMERLKRANDDHHSRSRGDGYAPLSAPQSTRYADANPYSAALPAPPMGYDRRR